MLAGLLVALLAALTARILLLLTGLLLGILLAALLAALTTLLTALAALLAALISDYWTLETSPDRGMAPQNFNELQERWFRTTWTELARDSTLMLHKNQ